MPCYVIKQTVSISAAGPHNCCPSELNNILHRSTACYSPFAMNRLSPFQL